MRALFEFPYHYRKSVDMPFYALWTLDFRLFYNGPFFVMLHARVAEWPRKLTILLLDSVLLVIVSTRVELSGITLIWDILQDLFYLVHSFLMLTDKLEFLTF